MNRPRISNETAYEENESRAKLEKTISAGQRTGSLVLG